jgi:hypothetical protein
LEKHDGEIDDEKDAIDSYMRMMECARPTLYADADGRDDSIFSSKLVTVGTSDLALGALRFGAFKVCCRRDTLPARDNCSQAAHRRRGAILRRAAFMKERPKTMVRRRDLLGVVLAGAGAAVASSVTSEPATAKPVDLKDKRKARYQANSAEVRNFYRVASYPAR